MQLKHRLLLVALAFLLAVATLPVVAGYWLLYTEPGLRRLVAIAESLKVVDLQFEDINGTVAGSLTAKRVIIDHKRVRIVVDDVATDLDPSGAMLQTIRLDYLRIGRVDVTVKPRTEPPNTSAPDFLPRWLAIAADAVSVDGFECGGHPGEDDVPNFILLPRAADELEIPFVSSGGMADGRSLVASLAMGAQGMNMGTRFIATKEAPVHDNVKQAILAASELDTRLVMRPLRNTERVMTNAAVEELLKIEREKGADLKFDDIIEQVAGVYPRIMMEGEMDAGAWSCGMVAGLIHDIPTCKELIDRIMREAHEIIARLGRLEAA